jgi:hypothetical protein
MTLQLNRVAQKSSCKGDWMSGLQYGCQAQAINQVSTRIASKGN